MKKLLFAAALVSGAALWIGDVSGHGGTYRGPGDTVPPGAGGGDGGGGSPGGAPPPAVTGGGSSGPSTPGAVTGGSSNPSGSGGARQTGGGGTDGGPDLDLWSFWWEFNKDRYLNLRDAIGGAEVTTGSEEWFLGQQARSEARDTMHPTREQRFDLIVPALKRALEKETHNDIVTGCLIALAKIGDRPPESPSATADSEIAAVIRPFLRSGNQEIRETAAVALGILAQPAAVPLLISLMEDGEEARRAVGSTEVSMRTRAFATYGLALVAARSSAADNALRQQIVDAYARHLGGDRLAMPDVSVAAMIGMGLVKTDPKTEGVTGWHREQQIQFVMDYFANNSKDRMVRAHAPMAAARLLGGLARDAIQAPREKLAVALIDPLDPRKRQEWSTTELRASAAQALGMIGYRDNAPSPIQIDARIREALRGASSDPQAQVQNFALISLGKIGARPGPVGSEPAKERQSIADYLGEQLAKGKNHTPHYAALAMGVMAHAMAANGEERPFSIISALGERLRGAKSPEDVGAFSIAAGMMRENSHREHLRRLLDNTQQAEAKGYVAVALGLHGAIDAKDQIQRVVRQSEYEPALLKQAAIALGLLGDRELVPDLVDMLSKARGLSTQASISQALGFIGDRRSVEPLIRMLENTTITNTARGFAAVALGIVGQWEPLPWNATIGEDLNYRASTSTLNDPAGTGILNIL